MNGTIGGGSAGSGRGWRRGLNMSALWLAASLAVSLPAAQLTLQHSVTRDPGGGRYYDAADSWMQEHYVNANHGDETFVRVQYNSGVGDTAALRFGLPTFTHEGVVGATLSLFYYDQSGMGSSSWMQIKPYRYTASWTEMGVTFNYRDKPNDVLWSGGYAGWYEKADDANETKQLKRRDTDPPAGLGTNNWVDFNVLPTVTLWNSGTANNGFGLFEYNANDNVTAFFFANQYEGDWAKHPKLTVTYWRGRISWCGWSGSAWDSSSWNWNVGGWVGAFGDDDYVTFPDGAGNPSISVTSGGVTPSLITINNSSTSYSFSGGPIKGTGELRKTGSGTVTLNASNSYSGVTTLTNGVLVVGNGFALGSTNSGTTVLNGARLELSNNGAIAAEPLTLYGTGGGLGALRNVSGYNTWSGPITLGSAATIQSYAHVLTNTGPLDAAGYALTLGGNSDIVVRGSIGGTGSTLTKIGDTSTVTLAASNSYSGVTTVSNGYLRLQHGFALGPTNVSVTIAEGGWLQVEGGIAVGAKPITSAGGATARLQSLSGDNSWAGSLTLNEPLNIYSDANTFTLTGPINAGNYALGFANSGTTVVSNSISGAGANVWLAAGSPNVVLTGDNSFGGTVSLSGGVLNVRHNHALGTSGAGTTVGGGCRLELQDNITIADESLSLQSTGNGLGGLRSVSGDNAWTGLITLWSPSEIQADAGTLALNSISASGYWLAFDCGGSITVTGAISGASASLRKLGSGLLTLTASNSYDGATTISNGVVNITHANALGATKGGTEVKAGGALEVQGSLAIGNEALTLNGAGSGFGALRSISGSNSWSGSIALSGAAAVQCAADTLVLSGPISAGNYNLTLSCTGDLTVSGSISGLMASVNKLGPGRLTLPVENSFGGMTFLNQGITVVSANNGLGTSAQGTLVQPLASLHLRGSVAYTTPEPLTIFGQGADGNGVLYSPDGSNVFSGPITLQQDSTVGVASGAVLELNGSLIGEAGLTKAGEGVLRLNAGSSYTRETTVSNGMILVSADSALGNAAGSTTVKSGATLGFRGSVGYSTPERLSIAGAGTGDLGVLWASDGNNSFAGPVTLSAASTIGVAQDAALTLNGVLDGDSELTKAGVGWLVLTENNKYKGGTMVSTGTLQVENHAGSATGSGRVTVSDLATLAGNGSIVGPVTLNGCLSPGSSVGTLATGPQEWNSRASFSWEISDATGTAGVEPGWDLLSVSGAINLQSTPPDPFLLRLISLDPSAGGTPGPAAHFNCDSNYTWPLASAGSVENFDPGKFLIDTLRFSNDTAGGTFLVETGSVAVRFTPNRTPVATSCVVGRRAGEVLRLDVNSLLDRLTSDPDGDDRALSAVSATSTNGGTVTWEGGFLIYSNANNVADTFTYTIRDVRPSYRAWDTVRTNTATLLVSVNTNQFLNVVSIETLGDGNKRITFAGIPMFPYLVQAATNLDMPIYWEILATNQAGSNGLWQYTDLSATNYLQRYYRSRQP